jgi:glycine dehydrogenase subunit 1
VPFIPHTEQEIAEMLTTIGVGDTAALFDEIPENLRVDGFSELPPGLTQDGLTEADISAKMRIRAAKDGQAVSFIGAGAYEHYIPAAVWDLATRGEFYSAYTPYQAEASQGTLQLIYEYQSMMAALTGLDVSNASLYDGATAFAEACLMAVRGNRKSTSKRILVSQGISPVYREVARNIVSGQGIELVEVPLKDGRTDFVALEQYDGEDFAAVCLQQPTFLGTLEEPDAITEWAHARDQLMIGICNPLSLAILRPPGDWGQAGADITCGEGQPLGIPVSSGGPYFGYMVCRTALMRQMPGRIVGRTVDLDGKAGFTLTMQAREQHIRRSKATSNICTNQGLMVTAATIHISLMGSEGLRRTALKCHANTAALASGLAGLPGVSLAFDTFFHEAVLTFDRPVAPLIDQLARQNILAGVDVSTHYPGLGNALLVCATEVRTEEEIDAYVEIMKSILKNSKVA